LIDELVYSPRGLDWRKTKALPETTYGSFSCRAVESHGAAQKVLRVQVTQEQVGVGDGRLSAAAPIASRTRVRTGAARSNSHQVKRVDPCDASATRANLEHLHSRDLQWDATPFEKAGDTSHLHRRSDRRPTIANHADLG